MQDFIELFGQKNIIIVCAVIAGIVLALLIIIVIEKISDKKRQKKLNEDVVLPYIENEPVEDTKLNMNDSNNDSIIEPVKENTKVEQSIPKSEVVYVEKKDTPEDAKKAIEEAAKKLAYEEEHSLSGPTFFERVQEEKSIISYDELIKSNIDVDQENDQVLLDEGNEPITIDELYNNQLEEMIKEVAENKESLSESVKEKVVFEKEESSSPKKFKNSEVISPVYGIKRDVVYQKEYNELGETINIKELDVEIAKTEEFLNQLKNLKDKLD